MWVLRFVVKLLVKVKKLVKFEYLEIEICGEVILILVELDKVGKFWVK